MIGAHGIRPWPPTSRETAHDPSCTYRSPGPGGHVCRDGCESYIEQVEAYWEGFDAAAAALTELAASVEAADPNPSLGDAKSADYIDAVVSTLTDAGGGADVLDSLEADVKIAAAARAAVAP